jgi:hypothetical protein
MASFKCMDIIVLAGFLPFVAPCPIGGKLRQGSAHAALSTVISQRMPELRLESAIEASEFLNARGIKLHKARLGFYHLKHCRR